MKNIEEVILSPLSKNLRVTNLLTFAVPRLSVIKPLPDGAHELEMLEYITGSNVMHTIPSIILVWNF